MAYVPNSGSVVAFQSNPSVLQAIVGLNSTNASVITVGSPVANQSVSGTVQADVRGSVATVIIGGSIAASFTPPANQSVSGEVNVVQTTTPWVVTGSIQTTITPVANQSVSGTVGASVIGHAPVVIVGGSILTSSTANQSVSGTIQAEGTQSAGVAATARPLQIGGVDVYGSVVTARFSDDGDQIMHLHSSIVSIVDNSPNQVAIPRGQNDASFMVSPAYGFMFDGSGWDRVRGNATNGMQIYGSVSGTVGASAIGTVPVTQGTSPWVITGSVQGDFGGGNSSVQVLNFPANQSVSGAVSISNFPTTQNVSGSVAAWLQSTNASVITVSTGGGNSSVMLLTGTNMVGSIATYQGSVPWAIAGSVAATIIGTPTVNTAGSVVAFQGGAPWAVTNVGSIITTNVGSVIARVSGSVATVQIGQSGTVITSISGTITASVEGTVTFQTASVVTGHGSVNGAASVQVLAAPGATLYNYVTDFTISNTGATTTLVLFTDGDASIIGKTIAPAGGGSNATSLSAPMRALKINGVVNIVAQTATSVLHAWVGGYRAP